MNAHSLTRPASPSGARRPPFELCPRQCPSGLSEEERSDESSCEAFGFFHLVVPKRLSTKGVTNKHFWERIIFPRTGKSEMTSPCRV